jgi:cytoskeletal protein CcmA (bactofilin family)
MALFPKKNRDILGQQISTLISEGCIVDGNLKASAFVRIEGQVNGDVTIEEGLILGEKGVVIGNIITKEMIAYGSVNGNINAHSLEIKSTGKITGEIKTSTLQVESGGFYKGNLSMAENINSHGKSETAA